jgi:glycosyltransferase involved in cell wall biosynthesis
LRLHVLIDSLALGGAEALVADFAVGARAAGIELSVGYLYEDGAAGRRLREAGIEPVRIPVGSLLAPSDRRAVREHLARISPDLLHTHLNDADLLGGLAARSLKIPTVSTLHVAWWGGDFRERLRFRLTALARRRCTRRVIAVSEAARRVYLERRWDRPDRVVVVHNGIIDDARPGAGAAIRRQLGIDEQDVVLAMVSVLRGWKGHEVAAAATERLLGRFPSLRLLILGDGPKRQEIERMMRPLGDRVVFAGFRDDVVAVLDAADVLVHPSRYDAFPTALMQAMAAGTPAVATAVGGIPEAVVDRRTGILVSPPATPDSLTAALELILEDSDLRARLGVAARRRFEAEYTADRWIERLLPVYETALGNSAAAPSLRPLTSSGQLP